MTLTHEEWLKERQKGIGGSDAAAIIGLSPWATPYTVWADKTGRIPSKEDNEAMRQGRDLEQYVADRWMEATEKKCRRRTKILRNPDYPFAHANVDRWVVGEKAGLECKTTSLMNLKKFKNGEYPETYYCQCVHYMAVTGAQRWYLAVLILNKGFYTFMIERDEEEIAALMEAERHFWQFVEKDTPPAADGLKPTTEVLNTMYCLSHDNQAPIDLFGQESTIQAYLDTKSAIKALEQQKEQYEQMLKESLGENELGAAGAYLVRWKPQQRSTFQAKAFAKDHPEIDLSRYYKKSQFRKFEIKEES